MSKLYIDVHEKNSIKDYLLKKLDVDVVEESLTVGDYVYEGVCIERKSSNDLVNSLFSKEGRLYKQLGDMEENFEYNFLLIDEIEKTLVHEALSRKDSSVYTSVIGSLSSIQAHRGVRVFHVETKFEFAYRIQSLINCLEGESERPVNTVKASAPTNFIQENLVAQIPGVGLKRSQDILNEFGSVYEFVNASIDDLVEIDGVGEKTAQNIIEIVSSKYEG